MRIVRHCVIAFLLLPLFAHGQTTTIDRIVDGDTLAITLKELPTNLQSVSIRLLGIDTPESNHLAKCAQEKRMGLLTKETISTLIANASNIRIELVDWDKYGGRVIGNVYLDGHSLANTLIEKGLADPYFGGKKQSWCD